MRKIGRSLEEIVPSVVLFREDLEEILSILKDSYQSVDIADSDFQYDSLKELVEKRQQGLSHLSISTSDVSKIGSYFSVRFDRLQLPGTWLWTTGKDGQDQATFLKIRDLLYRRQNWLNHLFRVEIATILFIILLLLPPLGIRDVFPGVSARLVIFLLIIGYVALTTLLRAGALSAIHLSSRYETKSFWSRHGEKIVYLVLGAVLAALAQWFVLRILG